MACTYRRNIINLNFILKNKYSPISLSQIRYLCYKDDLSGNSMAVDNSSKGKKDENPGKKEGRKSKFLRFKSTPLSDEQKEAAKQKLKSLLSDIEIKPEGSFKSQSNLNLAKAVPRISKKERLKQMEDARITPEKEMNEAVKAVASTFQEDSEKVETELSEKLSTLNLVKDAKEEVPITEDISPMESEVNKNLMSSVEEVADTISDNPIPPRSELAERLMRLSLDRKITADEKKSMKSVIEGMIIKKTSPEKSVAERRDTEIRKEQTFQRRVSEAKPRKPRKIERINLYGAPPFNIFTPGTEMEADSINEFWQKLQEREVRLLTQFAPANAFEEMIMWTEQGKHWKLPVDNETEMGEEENVGFHEHVFLEKHLEGFPTKGPIRHFMELVCVGLSKNPYITVERKIENIEWFRNYFKDKEDILRDAGALDNV